MKTEEKITLLDYREALNVGVKRVPFYGDSWGGCSELVVLSFEPSYHFNLSGGIDCRSFGFKRAVIHWLREHIESNSHPDHVYSAYDCTGQAFGSNWKRLDVDGYDESISVVYKHSWAIDI